MGCAFADTFDFRRMQGIDLRRALALLLGADLGGARQREGKRRLKVWTASDLAADVADHPAKPAAQEAQLSTMAIELLGTGIAPSHHRRPPGNRDVGLPQPHAVLVGQPVESLDRRMQQLGAGREGNVLGLHRGVAWDPRQVLASRRPGGMRHPQALGQ